MSRTRDAPEHDADGAASDRRQGRRHTAGRDGAGTAASTALAELDARRACEAPSARLVLAAAARDVLHGRGLARCAAR